jgi:archaellum component FlaF (FlaF/FlaG flagellin family)
MSKHTLIPLIISILALLVAGGAYAATFISMSKLQERSFSLAEEIHASLDKEARISRAERTLTLINSQEKTVHEYLVSDDTVVDFLEILEGIEERTNAQIDIVSVAASAAKDGFTVNLTVEGSFKKVMQTLGAIEQLPVFISINQGAIETIIRDGDTESLWTASASYSVRQK